MAKRKVTASSEREPEGLAPAEEKLECAVDSAASEPAMAGGTADPADAPAAVAAATRDKLAEPAVDNVISIALKPNGLALSPLERARQNPLLNWLSPRAAMIALAAGIGALVGTMATNGITYAVSAFSARNEVSETAALRSSVSQLAAEIASLKLALADGGPRTAQIAGLEQFRADVSREITGSVARVGQRVAAGWALLRVANGRALVTGAPGSFEVMPGSTLPGLGMVQRIMQDEGAWIVQTQGGTIRAGG